jgi:hypothetical protein
MLSATNTTTTLFFRSVSRIINSIKTTDGGGFIVYRPFPTDALLDFDPFLLLDEIGPKYWKPGEAKGASDILTGDLRLLHTCLMVDLSIKILEETRKLGPGDVQWMTTGAGVSCFLY